MIKRGISTIVASVLIVLVTVAAVSILWAAVSPLISQVAFVEDPNVNVKIEKGDYTAYDQQSNFLSLRVNRGPDEADIVGLKFVITDAGTNYLHTTYDVLTPNSGKVYSFLMDDSASIDAIEVVPIYSFQGGERESEFTDSIDFIRPATVTPTSVEIFGLDSSEGNNIYDSLVVFYPYNIDLATGNNVTDLSGNGHDGTLSADAYIANGVLNLDGSGDLIQMDNDPALNPSQFTVSVWVNSTDWSGNEYNYIYSNSRNSGGSNRGVDLRIMDTGTVRMRLWGSDGVARTVNSPNPMSTNVWHHVVMIYNGSKSAIYIDGAFDSIGNNAVGVGQPATYASKVACMGHVSWCTFVGVQDDFMLFNRSLTAEEIQKLYDVGRSS